MRSRNKTGDLFTLSEIRATECIYFIIASKITSDGKITNNAHNAIDKPMSFLETEPNYNYAKEN